MVREIKIQPWDSIFYFKKYEIHTLTNFVTLIAKDKNNDYFYFYDDIEKLYDVSNMPSYIKEDWLNYNKKILNISVLNSSIKECKELLEMSVFQENKNTHQQQLDILTSLRRDLIIKGLT